MGDKYKTFKNTVSLISRNIMLLSDLLRQCQPDSEYSALCSTVLHSNDECLEIKNNLIYERLWNDNVE